MSSSDRPLEKRTSQLGFCDRHTSSGVASIMYILGGLGCLFVMVYLLSELVLSELSWNLLNILLIILFLGSMYVFIFGIIISKKCFEGKD